MLSNEHHKLYNLPATRREVHIALLHKGYSMAYLLNHEAHSWIEIHDEHGIAVIHLDFDAWNYAQAEKYVRHFCVFGERVTHTKALREKR